MRPVLSPPIGAREHDSGGMNAKSRSDLQRSFFPDIDAVVLQKAEVGRAARTTREILLRPAFQFTKHPNYLTGRKLGMGPGGNKLAFVDDLHCAPYYLMRCYFKNIKVQISRSTK